MRKGSQRHSSDLGMEHSQFRVRPQAPKRPRLTCFHLRASLLHLAQTIIERE